MAEELLQARHNFKEPGKNWTVGFFNCHPVLQSKYSHTLDPDQFLAQNRDSIQQCLDLYWSIKAKHGILDKDIWWRNFKILLNFQKFSTYLTITHQPPTPDDKDYKLWMARESAV